MAPDSMRNLGYQEEPLPMKDGPSIVANQTTEKRSDAAGK